VNHSKAAGLNWTHIETLILGYPSNPSNLIDDPANKTEIKSCKEFHDVTGLRYSEKRAGHFKINYEQHKYLLEINGFYLFCVQDGDQGPILHKKKIRARKIELKFKFLERTITKHHYFSLNWRKALK
jgi:hypothetical protein